MNGQTAIEPCAICGAPAESEVSLGTTKIRVPAQGGGTKLVEAEDVRWLCGAHRDSARRDRGWQARAQDAARKRTVAMKQTQDESRLF